MVQNIHTIYDSHSSPITNEEKKARSDLQKTNLGAHRILFRAKSVFPFDLFPDVVVIDENKVDFVYGIFFYSSQVFSVSIRNINGAMSSTNLFFGSLEIEVSGYNKNPDPVTYLLKSDAAKARRIINGLVTCYKQGIDTTVLNLQAAKDKVEEIGKAQ